VGSKKKPSLRVRNRFSTIFDDFRQYNIIFFSFGIYRNSSCLNTIFIVENAMRTNQVFEKREKTQNFGIGNASLEVASIRETERQ